MGYTPELVVVVDDDEAVRRALTFSLRLEGLNVEAHDSGDDFLATSPKNLGCIVVDYRMPGMDGVTLVEHLRKTDRSLPAILIASKVDSAVLTRAKAAGFDLVLEKPLEDAALIDGIKAALTRPRIGSDAKIGEGT